VRIDPSATKGPKVRVAPGAAIPDAEFEEEAESTEKDRNRLRR